MGLQSLMRAFSIRTRMVSAIGVVLALLLVVGGAGVWGIQKLQHISQEFMGHALEESYALSRLRHSLSELVRYEKEMVIQYESPEQLSAAESRWERARQDVRTQMAHMNEGDADEDNAVLKTLEQNLAAYEAAVTPVVTNIRNGGYDSATVANRMLQRAHERFAAIEADLKKIETIIAAEAAALQAREQETTRSTLMVFAAAVVLAMVIVVPTTLANMQSICQPLTRAQDLAAAIAQGDLTQPVQADGKDELTALMHALGRMQVSLARMVGEVRATTNQIAAASTEIASGNQDLSNRTENAASQLQQTASSIEQIHGMVSQSTNAANEARDKARANAEVAQRGGAVVGQVVSTMEDIRHSSQKIHDIIGTIDGIAFQTNILALNAAVEAARAGEQGRGFAVVAGEVRRLAQSSAEAAQEIKDLIGASVERVETGSRQVSEAGRTIGEIVSNAQQIASLIQDVNSAANEQGQGIAQVTGAIGSLDSMTQQNAALVEQSAAAAQSLQEQARRLAGLVDNFRLPAAA